MSWLYSRALVAEYSAENFLDGKLSVRLSGTPTLQAYCAPGKMKDFSRLSRFGMTFKPSTEIRGEELLTWFRAVSRAKTSAVLAEAKELKEKNPQCGSIWHGSLARFDHVSRSWKTPQCSLLEGLDTFSGTWPRWGIMRDGVCSELTKPGLHIDETESGFWPTPNASEAKSDTINVQNRIIKGKQIMLCHAVRMFPTPTAHNAVEKCFPAEANRKTPTLAWQARGGDETQPRTLNPEWVEWLMGWPLGWTGCDVLATDKFQQWCASHGKPSTKSSHE